MIYSKKSTYMSSFQEAIYNDEGVKLYEGDTNGTGVEYYSNGLIMYEGEYKDGVRNGKGFYYYPDGNLKYEGEFEDGEYSGEGILYYDDGKLKYEGEFKDGVLSWERCVILSRCE